MHDRCGDLTGPAHCRDRRGASHPPDGAWASGGSLVTAGTLRSLGYFTQGILQSGDSGLYPVDGDYLVVNLNGDSSSQAPVAAIRAPASHG